MRKLTPKIFFIFLISIVLISFLAFNFYESFITSWTQQTIPNVGTQVINDVCFVDSLTGFMVTSKNTVPDSGKVLRTTNGGNNWVQVFSQSFLRLNKIKFVNANIWFAAGATSTGSSQLIKTTNQGNNWLLVSTPFTNDNWEDMCILNADTMWLADRNSLFGGIYRSTNGGNNWHVQFSETVKNPDRVYMFNGRIGFMARTGKDSLYKTTNSGVNWTIINNFEDFYQMKFTDSLTGWKADGKMKKTTNGGVTWQEQPMPSGNFISAANAQILSFTMLNKDTIIGVGGKIMYPSSAVRGIIFKTTNGGNLWGYQVPDTSFGISQFNYINFINKNRGWVYSQANKKGLRTVTGLDSTLTSTGEFIYEHPQSYALHQNYPNPFNPSTQINYELKNTNYVTLKVFDLNGKEIAELVNQKQNAGIHSVDFNAVNFPSGIYFYTLEAGDFKETRKMLLVK